MGTYGKAFYDEKFAAFCTLSELGISQFFIKIHAFWCPHGASLTTEVVLHGLRRGRCATRLRSLALCHSGHQELQTLKKNWGTSSSDRA